MDFAFTDEQQVFRRDVQNFFAEERVQRLVRDFERCRPHEEEHAWQIYQWLGERGWLASHWPHQYGGLNKTPIEAAIVSEEMSLAGVPDTVHVNTIDIIGTFLLLAGTEEQKKKFLPLMARGEMIISVLYTEPQAGSDLASLTARAEVSADGFRLYAHKIYSLKSFMAHYALVAVRTAPGMNPYTGISLFLVPLLVDGVRPAGVVVNPIWNITNERFNEITLDGVEVNQDALIGPLHGGWSLINEALSLERTGLDYYAKVRRWLYLMLERASVTGQLQNPAIGPRLAMLQAQVEAGRWMAWRIIAQQVRGEVDAKEAAMSKWYNTDFARSLTRLALEMEGLDGALSGWDGEAPMKGLLEAAHRECPGLTISAGTSEVMLHLIASTL